jgi:hypothetical protein
MSRSARSLYLIVYVDDDREEMTLEELTPWLKARPRSRRPSQAATVTT